MAPRLFLFLIPITGSGQKAADQGGVLRYINQLNFLECAGNQSIQRHLEVHNVFEVEWFDQTPSVVEH
ncbi:MAG: hypothetical protein E3J30_11875 [Anaerolineales bacterium]|nr:MAG: hypothetical protein E3J30_11875 [Anaerolineales bacterium]